MRRTKKTRDYGLDGVVEIDLPPLGKTRLGLETKWKKADSRDVDHLIAALNNAEIRLGVLACRDSAKLHKYLLSSKVKALLFFHDVKASAKGVPPLQIEPVFILKFDDILDIFSNKVRGVVSGVYKR